MSRNSDDKIAKIHATLDRFAKLIADNQAKADARQAEADVRQAEADVRQAEAERSAEELRAQIKETSAAAKETLASINRLYQIYQNEGDRWGKIAESLLSGGLSKAISERFNIRLSHVSRNVTFENLPNSGEIDVIGVNGDLVVVVEVKTTLAKSDINKFKNKILDCFATLMPEYKDREVYGGVAYIRTADKENETDVVAHSEDLGLFVIKIIGDSNKVVNSKGFTLHNYRSQR